MGGDWLAGTCKLPNAISGITKDLSVVEGVGESSGLVNTASAGGGSSGWINVC